LVPLSATELRPRLERLAEFLWANDQGISRLGFIDGLSFIDGWGLINGLGIGRRTAQQQGQQHRTSHNRHPP
jgi:hypothetical protein